MTTNLHSLGRPLTQGWRNKASIVQAYVHVHVLIQYRYLQSSRSTYFLWWRTCQIAISCKGGPPRFSSGVGMQKSCSQRRSSFHAFSQLFSSHRPLLRLVQLHAALILRCTYIVRIPHMESLTGYTYTRQISSESSAIDLVSHTLPYPGANEGEMNR